MKKWFAILFISVFLVSAPVAVFAEGGGSSKKGYIEGDTYYNESLGLQFTLEEGWEFDQSDDGYWMCAERHTEEEYCFVAISARYIGHYYEDLTQEDFKSLKQSLMENIKLDGYDFCDATINLKKPFLGKGLGQIILHQQLDSADDTHYQNYFYRFIPVLQDGYRIDIEIGVLSDINEDTTEEIFGMFQPLGDRFSSVGTLNMNASSSQPRAYNDEYSTSNRSGISDSMMRSILTGIAVAILGGGAVKARTKRLQKKNNLEKGMFEGLFTKSEIELHYLKPGIYTYYQMKRWCRKRLETGDFGSGLLGETGFPKELFQKVSLMMEDETQEYNFVMELSPEERRQFQMNLVNPNWIYSTFLLNYYGEQASKTPLQVLENYTEEQYEEDIRNENGAKYEEKYQSILRIMDPST